MSTFITVSSGSGALVTRVKQVQQVNREAQLQRENDTALQLEATAQRSEAEATAERPTGGNPDTSIKRRPAAHRTDDAFMIIIQQIRSGPRISDDLIVSINDKELATLDFLATAFTGPDYCGYAFLPKGATKQTLLASRFYETTLPALQTYMEAVSEQVYPLPQQGLKRKPEFNTVVIATVPSGFDASGEIYTGYLSKKGYGQRTWNVPTGEVRELQVPWWGLNGL